MIIALWVVIIHLIELAVIGAFLLIRRNNTLEKAFAEQQQYIDAIGIIAADGEVRLKEGYLVNVSPKNLEYILLKILKMLSWNILLPPIWLNVIAFIMIVLNMVFIN
jgi:hypothetical protein